MICSAVSSSLFFSINSLNESTMSRALVADFLSKPANATLSLLTVSIVCSLRFLMSSRAFLNFGSSNRLQAFLDSSSEAFLIWSADGVSVLKSSLAFSSCLSGSTTSNNSLIIPVNVLPLATASSSVLSFSSICTFSLASLAARDDSVSLSLVPRATELISLSKGMLLLLSNGRVSVFLFSQTPTASTITKDGLCSAEGVTAIK